MKKKFYETPSLKIYSVKCKNHILAASGGFKSITTEEVIEGDSTEWFN